MFTTNTDSANAAFGPLAPRRFSRLRDFARDAGRRAQPYSCALDALDAGKWSSGPAGFRASRVGETAITEAYKAGQLERARSAMADYAADHARNPRVERLIEIGARVTAVSDGDWSTLITADDLVDLTAEFVAIDDREDALFDAEEALRAYHVHRPELTTAEAAEVEAELEEIEAHLIHVEAGIDPFDRDARLPLPVEEADEIARLERRRLQSINWLVRYARNDEPFADKLARLGLVATDNEIDAARAAHREFWESEVASLKLATANGEFVGFDPSAVEPIRFETIEPEGPSLADRARALADEALKAGDNKLHAALVRMQNGMEAGQNGQASLKIRATPYVWIGSKNIPPRPWVLGEWLLRKTAAAAIAPGGVGKSTFMASMALSLITGRPLLGKKVHGGKQRVWTWNLEDPLDELQRSLEAGADHYGINSEDVADRLFVDSAMEGTGLCTAVEGREGFKLLAPVYEAITEELIDRKIDVLIVDPFVSSHEIDENDNSKVDSIAKAWGRVANAANCSIVLVHHTSEAGAGEVTVMSGRGAVSLTSACRCALVFNRMDDVTAASLGFDDAERRRYFTVSDDKHNRAPAALADWFKLESVGLDNGHGNLARGDSVGVVVPWTRPDPFDGVTTDDLSAVQDKIANGEWRESAQADQWAGKAAAEVFGLDVTKKPDRKRIEQLIKTWIANGALVVVERPDAGRKLRKFIEVGHLAAPAPPRGAAR